MLFRSRGFSELREAGRRRRPPSGKKKKTPHHSYMSSCPFADLVVVALLLAAAAVVAVVLLHALACAPRSMHQGLHGWNKSSSMLRDGFGVKYSGFLHIRPCSFLRGD